MGNLVVNISISKYCMASTQLNHSHVQIHRLYFATSKVPPIMFYVKLPETWWFSDKGIENVFILTKCYKNLHENAVHCKVFLVKLKILWVEGFFIVIFSVNQFNNMIMWINQIFVCVRNSTSSYSFFFFHGHLRNTYKWRKLNGYFFIYIMLAIGWSWTLKN